MIILVKAARCPLPIACRDRRHHRVCADPALRWTSAVNPLFTMRRMAGLRRALSADSVKSSTALKVKDFLPLDHP